MVGSLTSYISKEMKSDILLVGQTPPPFHGQAVVTGMLFDHDWNDLKVERLRMAFSEDIESVGEASWMKIWKLLVLILSTWKVALVNQPKVLYYLPASPNMTPVLRDVVYLAAVRWLFPKTVFHYHAGGLDGFIRGRKWLRRLTKWVYDGADCSVDVNVTNPPSGEYFKAHKDVVVMNGLDVGAAERKRPEGAVFQVLYLGLLCEPKGVMELVETARILDSAGCVCEFVMVGGWESDAFKAEFESALEEAGIRRMFHFRGVCKGDEKWQAYADADTFIFPTHHPTETFGLVLIEAMAMGLPIVTNRWRSIPHVVGEDGCAIICEAKSPQQYADAIRTMKEDVELRNRMGETARSRYETHFTRERFVTAMEDVFRNVLQAE